MTESPLEQLLGAIDALDVDAVMVLAGSDCSLLVADGRRAEGKTAFRELVADFLAELHSVSHRITAQWHEQNVWIAEVEATYELKDRLRMTLPRAFVLREGQDGFSELHVYGAHERSLADHRTGEEGLRIGGRWIPPL